MTRYDRIMPSSSSARRPTPRPRATPSKAAVTAVAAGPRRPSLTDGWRWVATPALTLAAYGPLGVWATDGASLEQSAGGIIALAAARVALHVRAQRSYARAQAARSLWDVLARITRDPADARAQRMRVTNWDSTAVRAFELTPGPDFPTHDTTEVRRLGETFTAHVGADRRHLQIERRKTGALRYSINPDLLASPNDAQVPDTAPPAVDAPPERQPEEVESRVAEAIGGVLGAKVTAAVQSWHTAGAPRCVVIDYPASSFGKVMDAIPKLGEVMQKLHPAHEDEWFMEWRSSHDRVLFEDRPDPLAPVVPLFDPERVIDLEAGAIVARDDQGQPFRLPLMGGKHWLCVGATGAGKGSFLWAIIGALEHLIAAGLVRLWVFDPKGGSELYDTKRFAHRFASKAEDIHKYLGEAGREMRKKAEAQAGNGRKVSVLTRERPLDLVIVDELADVAGDVCNSLFVGENEQNLRLLLSQGRSPAFTVIACVQNPRKDNVRMRNLFPGKVALRLDEASEANITLGQGVRAKGVLPDLIPDRLPGVGYVLVDGKSGHKRLRFPWTSDDDTAALAQRLAPMQPPAIGAPVPGGEQMSAWEPEPEPAERPVVATKKAAPRPALEAVAPSAEGELVLLRAVKAGQKVHLDGDPVPSVVRADPFQEEGTWLLTRSFVGESGASDVEFEDGEMARLVG